LRVSETRTSLLVSQVKSDHVVDHFFPRLLSQVSSLYMVLEMKKMNSRKNVKVGNKVGWKWSRLIGRNHLNIGLSSLTNSEDASINLNAQDMEKSVQDAWLNLELSKAYADKLRSRIV
jgi:hypothetical protein